MEHILYKAVHHTIMLAYFYWISHEQFAIVLALFRKNNGDCKAHEDKDCHETGNDYDDGHDENEDEDTMLCNITINHSDEGDDFLILL